MPSPPRTARQSGSPVARRRSSPGRSRAAASVRSPIETGCTGRRSTPSMRNEHSPNWEQPRYERGSMEATRRAYAEALVALGRARGEIVALDGDVDNSTYTELFEEALPERYFEMYIAEQQMAAAAVGLQVRGWIPFASTYGAFWSRAFDFIRMAAVSRANIRLAGSHAGVSIG